MDLNDTLHFADVDTEDMLGHIDGLPAQLQMAYQLGSQLKLPPMQPVNRVVVAGMGGSAIGADLLAAYLADQLVVPFYVHRDYGLPKYAMGERTLLVISSHSGDTEESLSAFEMGRANECQLLAICTGGKLAREAEEHHIPLWKFDHSGQLYRNRTDGSRSRARGSARAGNPGQAGTLRSGRSPARRCCRCSRASLSAPRLGW